MGCGVCLLAFTIHLDTLGPAARRTCSALRGIFAKRNFPPPLHTDIVRGDGFAHYRSGPAGRAFTVNASTVDTVPDFFSWWSDESELTTRGLRAIQKKKAVSVSAPNACSRVAQIKTNPIQSHGQYQKNTIIE
jgi:hypothetical protein